MSYNCTQKWLNAGVHHTLLRQFSIISMNNKKLGKADLHHAGADDVGLWNEHVELAQHPWQNGLLNHALQQFQVQDNQY